MQALLKFQRKIIPKTSEGTRSRLANDQPSTNKILENLDFDDHQVQEQSKVEKLGDSWNIDHENNFPPQQVGAADDNGGDVPSLHRDIKPAPGSLVKKRTKNQNLKELSRKRTLDLRDKAFEIVKGVVIKKVLDINEYEIGFNMKRAIVMFIVHMLYFFIGPPLLLVILLFKGKDFTNNLGFISNKIIFMYYQNAQFVLTVLFLVCYFTVDMPSFSYGDVILLLITLTMRATIISVRYGLMSKIRYGLMHTKLSLQYIRSDLIAYCWYEFTPKSLQEEIRATKNRCEIDEDEFSFSFIEDVPENLKCKLNNEDHYDKVNFNLTGFRKLINQQFQFITEQRKLNGNSIYEREFEDIHELENDIKNESANDPKNQGDIENSFKSESFNESEESKFDQNRPHNNLNYNTEIKPKKCKQYYSCKGDTLLREIALLELGNGSSSKILELVCIIRLFLPFLVRILEGNYWLGEYWYEYFATLGLFYLFFILYRWNAFFCYVGVTDFRRKLFYMKVLQSLISIEKDKSFPFSSYFPTLNICCSKNLNSWLWLRQACMDLGRKYTLRIFCYCSIFLGFYLVFLVFMLLVFFGILDYELPYTLYITGTYDIILILSIIFCMLKTGAEINEYFETFKGILIKQKKYFWDAKSHMDNERSSKFTRCKSFRTFLDLMHRVESQHKDRDKYIDNCITFLEMTIQKLDYEKQNSPLKLMGLTASRELIKTIYTASISIAFAFSQLLYKKYQ